MRELAIEVRQSTGWVVGMLAELTAAGAITREPGRARTIRIVDPASRAPLAAVPSTEGGAA